MKVLRKKYNESYKNNTVIKITGNNESYDLFLGESKLEAWLYKLDQKIAKMFEKDLIEANINVFEKYKKYSK